MNLKAIWQHLWEALFPSTDKGFSIKNIMAAVTHISLIFLTFKHTDSNNIIVVLGMWQTFLLTLVGVRAWEKSKGILTEQKESDDKAPQ